MLPHQRQILQSFMSLLPPKPRLLFLHSSRTDLALQNETVTALKAHGCEVEEIPSSKDLRFLNPQKETYDGAWCDQSLVAYSIEDVQRILASLFKALKPRAGALTMTYLAQAKEAEEATEEAATEPAQAVKTHRYPEQGFASLLRQNGYQIQTQGRREHPTEGTWIAILAKRI